MPLRHGPRVAFWCNCCITWSSSFSFLKLTLLCHEKETLYSWELIGMLSVRSAVASSALIKQLHLYSIEVKERQRRYEMRASVICRPLGPAASLAMNISDFFFILDQFLCTIIEQKSSHWQTPLAGKSPQRWIPPSKKWGVLIVQVAVVRDVTSSRLNTERTHCLDLI